MYAPPLLSCCIAGFLTRWVRHATNLSWCLLAAWAALGSSAEAAPLAGSRLDNTAHATYFDTDRGFNATIQSNTVSITVQALEALTLTSNNMLQRAAGGNAGLTHRLTNTGNASSRYTLRFANRSDDDHDLTDLRLVWDRNGNGIADANEPVLGNGDEFGPLAPGEFADLVLLGGIADGVGVGRVARLDLSARSVAQGVTAANIDSVTVADGALMQLAAGADKATPQTGDRVLLTLTASNTGNRPASGLPVTVDGATLALVLLRDVIPANTTLTALGAANGALPLYHLQGQPEHNYTRTPPADLRQVDAVAFGFAADIAPGQSFTRSLEVQINPNAAGPIDNIGRLLFMDGLQTQPVGVDSNPVRMVVPDQPPALKLFADANYTRPAKALAAGQPFYVSFVASRCNLDPLRAETQQLTVSSVKARDIESFVATETGPNTGEFRIEPSVPTTDALHTPLVRGDGRLSVKPNDELTVSVTGCGATLLQANVLVDPFGVVFDSKTSALLAGAVVSLFDVTGAGNGGHPNGLANVFLDDGVTAAPNVLTTGADGAYRFPLVAPSVYRLQVVPPTPYAFPSTLATSLQPAERLVDAGSYGAQFTITAESEPVHLDIPLDADSRAGFFIEKTASRRTVELGEFVDYQIKIKNVTGQLLGRIRVNDRLPTGFAYLRGSARIDGRSTRYDGSVLPEPEGKVGPALVFNVGSLNDAAVLTLTYRVRVGPGALRGDGINRAQATTAGPLPKLSNESSALVQVLPGVFSDRGFLLGNVYADCNDNRERDDGEPGIAGVRLYLEDGTHVTTDRLGRYSLYGLKPQTHVLKLDRTSLPFNVGAPGEAQLALLANRNAGDAGSRFIDMKNGELQRADFAVAGCSDAVQAAIAARSDAVARTEQFTETARDARLAADPRLPPVTDPKALPASGVIGSGVGAPLAGSGSAGFAALFGGAGNPAGVSTPTGSAALPSPPKSAAGLPSSAASAASAAPTLTDEAMATLDNSPVIVSPSPAQVLGFAQTTVVVKGALGVNLELRVNGTLLSASRIGRLRSLESRALQVAEYVGVDLKPGVNTLELLQPAADSPGVPGAAAVVAGRHSITVIAPGTLAQLRLSAPTEALPADGRSLIKVVIEPLDAAGVAVTSPTPVTLNASNGRWQQRDLDPDEPGLQVFVEGGRMVVELESPGEPGDVLVQAASGAAQSQAKLSYIAELRPMIAAGVIEGVLNLRNLKGGAVKKANPQDGFEQALKNVSTRFDNGRGDVGARGAVFLKGKVLGSALLTLAYDSDKDTRERLFRDIQPGEFYPVYGDDSVKGFEAQSTGRLYVRLDRGKSYALYGDFNTQTEPRVQSRTGRAVSNLDGSGAVGANATTNGSAIGGAIGSVNASPNFGAIGGAYGLGGVPLDERRLGQFSRSLNGVRGHLETDDGSRSVTAFAAKTTSRQVIDELPAVGTSGPFALSKSPLIENSEKVELLTRDRSQNSLVLRRVPLTRFVDYEIETLGGGILLKGPLPSLDADFNPNSLRVTYEVDRGGVESVVSGVNGRIDLNELIALSAGVVRDNDPLQPLTLYSLGGTLRLAAGTSVAAEAAHTDTPLGLHASGNAARIELRHDGNKLQAQAQVVNADAGFDNPSASVTRARRDVTAKATYRLSEKTLLKAEGLLSDDLASSASRSGEQLSIEHAWSDKLRGEIGVRHSSGIDLNAPLAAPSPAASASAPIAPIAAPAASPATANSSSNTVLAKLIAQVPSLPKASVFTEVEQDVEHSARREAAVGGEYRYSNATRLYARHELISSLGSRYGLNDSQQRNATVFGVQTEYLPEANLVSEYRMREAIDGRQAEAAIGLRNRWKLGDGWSLSSGFERVHSVDGKNSGSGTGRSGEGTSVVGGVEYTGAPNWKGATRLELRHSTSSDSLLSTVGVSFKIDEAWTALGRNLLSVLHQRNAADKTEDWLQFGLAWRERGANRRNALMRVEYRTTDTSDPLLGDSGRQVVIVSGHMNQQVNARLSLAGRLAGKWAQDQSPGLSSTYHTELIAGRLTYDLTPKWDIGLQASALIGGGGRAQQLGLGGEVGYLLAKNLWFSVGWNVLGFSDRDLTAQDYTQLGGFLRLRFKFDEGLF